MWEYYNDSTVSIDSVQFKLYLIDSSKSSNVEQLQLFLQSDSYFNENQSTYLDYEGFSTNDWYEISSSVLSTYRIALMLTLTLSSYGILTL